MVIHKSLAEQEQTYFETTLKISIMHLVDTIINPHILVYVSAQARVYVYTFASSVLSFVYSKFIMCVCQFARMCGSVCIF